MKPDALPQDLDSQEGICYSDQKRWGIWKLWFRFSESSSKTAVEVPRWSQTQRGVKPLSEGNSFVEVCEVVPSSRPHLGHRANVCSSISSFIRSRSVWRKQLGFCSDLYLIFLCSGRWKLFAAHITGCPSSVVSVLQTVSCAPPQATNFSALVLKCSPCREDFCQSKSNFEITGWIILVKIKLLYTFCYSVPKQILS